LNLAQTNKEIRKELELLTTEARALSAIYWRLQQLISEDQKDEVKSEARKFVSSNFTKEEIDAFYKRNSDRASHTALERDVLEIIKPQETK